MGFKKGLNIQMLNKKFFLLMLAAFLLVSLAACTPAQKKVNVDVKILGYNDELIYEGNFTAIGQIVKAGEDPVVADLLLSLKNAELISDVEFTEGHKAIEKINSTKRQPDAQNTGAYFWTYSINGVEEAAEKTELKGPSEDKIKDGDKIIFHYEWLKYAEEKK